MKIKTSTIFWTFIWCWFMGVTVFSIGFGAVFPSLNRIAQPFVCLDGRMELAKDVYNPYPGNTITTITWYCVEEASGTQTELGIFPMVLYAGTIYGLLFFLLVFAGMLFNANRRPGTAMRTSRAQMVNASRRNSLEKLNTAEDSLSRMMELKNLRDSNLISEKEFEEKRAQILKDL